MNVSIIQRKLTESEITSLINDGKLFPHVPYVSRVRWQNLHNPYIVELNNTFAAVCAVYYFDNWVKLGPLEILDTYHGRGLGKILLNKIIEDNIHLHIYIGSSNPAVIHIIESFKFHYIPHIFSLPKEVKIFLFKKMTEHLSFTFFYEGLKKNFFLLRKDMKHFIKCPQLV